MDRDQYLEFGYKLQEEITLQNALIENPEILLKDNPSIEQLAQYSKNGVLAAWAMQKKQVESQVLRIPMEIYVRMVVQQQLLVYDAMKTYFMFEHEGALCLKSNTGFNSISLRLLFSAIFNQRCVENGIEPQDPAAKKLRLQQSFKDSVKLYSNIARNLTTTQPNYVLQQSMTLQYLSSQYTTLKVE